MQAIAERPLPSVFFDSLNDFQPDDGSTYLYASSNEERSQIAGWIAQVAQPVRFIEIESQAESAIFFARANGIETAVSLKSRSQLQAFADTFQGSTVYLDFTGLDHSTWAGILRALLKSRIETRAVYVEPREYAYSLTPTEGTIFDLSDRIRGLTPIPGFTSLQAPTDDFIFVPCLGFEGTRLAYLIEQLQPTANNIVPIVGVPGFQVEYPFLAFWGNKLVLAETKAWKRTEYAKADCPFSLYHRLSDIAAANPGRSLKIAPIGTKPHALGAFLFQMTANNPDVEIVYDHPIRKAKRTSGSWRAAVYYISSFVPAL